MLAFLLLGLWMSLGAVGCSLLAARKGHDETQWLVLGVALGPVGLVALSLMRDLVPVSYLVHNPRLPDLVECPSCRSVVPVRPECAQCSEPLATARPPRRRWEALRLGRAARSRR